MNIDFNQIEQFANDLPFAIYLLVVMALYLAFAFPHVKRIVDEFRNAD